MTDDLGQYEFADLPRGFTYLLTARREGFAELTATIDLTTVDVFLVVDLDLPPFDRIEPPVGDLRVWADAVGGFGLDEPSITFRLRLENVGSVVLRDLVITDSLDARADGYRLKPEDLSFVGGAFPGARLEIAEDGRSFIVEVDELAPTTSPVELLRLTIPTPPDAGVYCNRVRARASAGESPARHDDSSCLAGGI